MKFATPFLLLSLFAFSACTTMSNRRELYKPAKASGPYTESLKTGTWRKGAYPTPKASSGATANAGAPAAGAQ